MISSAFWLGKRVFITGHTGFNGSWLTLMLARLNARATGYALEPPTAPNMFALCGAGEFIDDIRGDVNDLAHLRMAMNAVAPEIVIHMATQPANVIGAVNVLEAARSTPSVRLVLDVTTAGKACAELAVSAWRDSNFSTERDLRVLSARADDSVGGGDFTPGHLVADAARAFITGETYVMKDSRARPWLHVLESLSGYLMLIERALSEPGVARSGWNFGAGEGSERRDEEFIARFAEAYGGGDWRVDGAGADRAASDMTKARDALGWTPLLAFDETAEWTAQWHRAYANRADMIEETLMQVDRYLGQRVRLTSPFLERMAAIENKRKRA